MTEARIQGAFDELAKGRTTLIIAHRLSTIRSAERILVIDNNRIAEEGTHEELMVRGGEYASLYGVNRRKNMWNGLTYGKVNGNILFYKGVVGAFCVAEPTYWSDSSWLCFQ